LAIIAQGRVCMVDVTHAEFNYPIDVYSFFGGAEGPGRRGLGHLFTSRGATASY
jgi:hypothetical protein